MELQKKAKEYLEAKESDSNDTLLNNSENVKAEQGEEGQKKGRKRKRTKEFDDNSSEESSEDEADDELPPGMEKKAESEKTENGELTKENDSEDANGELKEESKENELVKSEENLATEPDKETEKEKNSVNDDKGKIGVEDKAVEEMDGMKPRPLHKVTSIFLRNLSPTITKQEVEAMCRRYPGFLRAAIADPSPERRWFRRGWVTFERDIKIKDICFNLNNIRLR